MNEKNNIEKEENNIVNKNDNLEENDNSKSRLLIIFTILIGLFVIYLYYNDSNSSLKIGTIFDISIIYQLSKISFIDIIILIYLIIINSKLKKLLKK